MAIDCFHNEYSWLSNFYPCDIIFESLFYNTVEEAYVASKTLDIEIRKHIQSLHSPSKAKRYGRLIELRLDWNEVKKGIMLDLLRQKFKHGTELGNKLVDTGTIELIEGNTWNDTYWGICNGVGQNNLGKLLMKVRSEINLIQF